MAKTIKAQASYTIPDDMSEETITRGNHNEDDNSVSCEFDLLVIDSVDDAIEELGEGECKSLLQKAIKIKQANSARVKLMSENKHLAYKEMSEETKAKMKLARQKNATAIKVLQGLSVEKLAELGIEL